MQYVFQFINRYIRVEILSTNRVVVIVGPNELQHLTLMHGKTGLQQILTNSFFFFLVLSNDAEKPGVLRDHCGMISLHIFSSDNCYTMQTDTETFISDCDQLNLL